MKIPKKRCRHCGRWYRPYVRRRAIQQYCSRRRCQRERHRLGCLVFHRSDPDCDSQRRSKIQEWARQYPDYWRRYRATHPAYRERERQRMMAKRGKCRNVAKRDVLSQIAVEKLADIRRQGSEFVAKRDVLDRRVDEVLDFLVWKETSQNETFSPAVTV